MIHVCSGGWHQDMERYALVVVPWYFVKKLDTLNKENISC
jgi:hypothetical protein